MLRTFDLLDHFIELCRGWAPAMCLAFRIHWALVAAIIVEFPLKGNLLGVNLRFLV